MIGIMATNKRIISVVLSKSSKSVILSLILLLPIKHRSQRVKVGIQNNCKLQIKLILYGKNTLKRWRRLIRARFFVFTKK